MSRLHRTHVARRDTSCCIACRRLHVSCIGDKIVVNEALRRRVPTCIWLHVSGVNAALRLLVDKHKQLQINEIESNYVSNYDLVASSRLRNKLLGTFHRINITS